MINVGIIGAGRIGQVHAKSILSARLPASRTCTPIIKRF